MTDNIERLAEKQNSPKEEQPTQKEILIEIAKSCELFHHDMIPYTRITRDGHKEVWPVVSRTFRLYLEQQYHQITGGSPSSNARTEAISTIEALARFGNEEHPVFRRVARVGTNIVIDIGDPAWSVIEVSDTGWQILSDSPVRFHRGKDAQSLPIPEKGGALDDLWHFINIKPDDRLPFLAWLVFSLMPDGPFVILVLRAFHGSGKSTTSRYTIALIDPRKGGLRSFPRDERDLAIASTNGWLMAFDNLSHIPHFISDALCRLTHGAGFATRTLYENTEETIIDAKRPVLMNSIGDIIDRPDLADRVLLLELPPLDGPRRTEAQIEADFQKKGPKIMGAILDLMVQVLRELPDVGYDGLPRMADFARVGIAVERVLQYPAGSFLAAYMRHREDLAANVLDHPVVAALFKILEDSSPSGWTGTFKELKVDLEKIASDADKYSPNWPKTAKKLGNDLRSMTPTLKTQGLSISFDGHSEKGSKVTLQKVGKEQSGRSDSQPTSTGAVRRADRWADHSEMERSEQSGHEHPDHSKKEQSGQQSAKKFNDDNNSDRPDRPDHLKPSFLFDPEEQDAEVF
jgi:hypothetical protein